MPSRFATRQFVVSLECQVLFLPSMMEGATSVAVNRSHFLIIVGAMLPLIHVVLMVARIVVRLLAGG